MSREYPQATPSGDPIPFEIIYPFGVIIQPFTGTVSGSVTIPEAADFLVFRCNMPCIVRFNAVAEQPTAGTHLTNAVYVDGYESIVIDHNDAVTFTVISAISGTGNDGTLVVQTCIKYTDVRKLAQLQRA